MKDCWGDASVVRVKLPEIAAAPAAAVGRVLAGAVAVAGGAAGSILVQAARREP